MWQCSSCGDWIHGDEEHFKAYEGGDRKHPECLDALAEGEGDEVYDDYKLVEEGV